MRLDRLMAPKSIAIFGASENPSPGRRILDALATLGYPGEVYPINPKYDSVVGRRCYPSIDALPPGTRADRYRHVITGEWCETTADHSSVPMASALATCPVALLWAPAREQGVRADAA